MGSRGDRLNRVYGLIPAAGASRRMGRSKLDLPLGDGTVLERVVRTLRDGGIETVLVVVGPHVPQLVPLAEKAGAQVLLLTEVTADMRATVEHGLTWLEHRYLPSPDDHWLLVPADHPTLDAEVVSQLLAVAPKSAGSIFIPTHAGRRGHPALIGWKHVAGIRDLPPTEGLNSYLRRQPLETVEVPTDSADVLLDLDTPEDYARVLGRG